MPSWQSLLPKNIVKLGDDLFDKAIAERNAGKTIYPPQEKIFRALQLTPPDKTKVCIVGQDPYHGPGQAVGLSFSVNPGVTPPPSLVNIFKELTADIGCPYPQSGDLTPWAEQGVLLLNTSLTVEARHPNSHAGWGWNQLTGAIVRACAQLPQPVVFILWGAYAARFIDDMSLATVMTDNKRILKSSHPSPYSAASASRSAPAFFGSRPFSTANKLLTELGAEPINWALP